MMGYLLVFLVCFLLQFLVSFEMNFINPIIPYLSSYFGIDKSSVIYLNIGFSFIGLLTPFFGMFTDKIGKKRGLIIATLFYIIGTFLSGLSRHHYMFAFSRIIIGIGSLTIGATVIAYISDFISYRQRGKAAGVLRISFALAILTGPALASYMVENFGLRALYWLLSSIAILALVILFKLPTDQQAEGDAQVNLSELGNMLKNKTTQKFVLASSMMIIAPLTLFSFFSIWLDQSFALNQSDIGSIYSIANSGTLVGVGIATLLSDKLGKLKTAKIGFVLMAITMFPLSFLGSIPMIIVVVMINTIGLDGGFLAFQTLASEVYPKRRTMFMTLISFSHSLCGLIFTILGPILYNLGGYTLLNFIGGIAGIIAVITLYSISKEKRVVEVIQASLN